MPGHCAEACMDEPCPHQNICISGARDSHCGPNGDTCWDFHPKGVDLKSMRRCMVTFGRSDEPEPSENNYEFLRRKIKGSMIDDMGTANVVFGEVKHFQPHWKPDEDGRYTGDYEYSSWALTVYCKKV